MIRRPHYFPRLCSIGRRGRARTHARPDGRLAAVDVQMLNLSKILYLTIVKDLRGVQHLSIPSKTSQYCFCAYLLSHRCMRPGHDRPKLTQTAMLTADDLSAPSPVTPQENPATTDSADADAQQEVEPAAPVEPSSAAMPESPKLNPLRSGIIKKEIKLGNYYVSASLLLENMRLSTRRCSKKSRGNRKKLKLHCWSGLLVSLLNFIRNGLRQSKRGRFRIGLFIFFLYTSLFLLLFFFFFFNSVLIIIWKLGLGFHSEAESATKQHLASTEGNVWARAVDVIDMQQTFTKDVSRLKNTMLRLKNQPPRPAAAVSSPSS